MGLAGFRSPISTSTARNCSALGWSGPARSPTTLRAARPAPDRGREQLQGSILRLRHRPLEAIVSRWSLTETLFRDPHRRGRACASGRADARALRDHARETVLAKAYRRPSPRRASEPRDPAGSPGFLRRGLGKGAVPLRSRGAPAGLPMPRAVHCCSPPPTPRDYGAGPLASEAAGARPAPRGLTCACATQPILCVERGGKSIVRLVELGRGAGRTVSQLLAAARDRVGSSDRARRRRAGVWLRPGGRDHRRRLLASRAASSPATSGKQTQPIRPMPE
jgi:hypothetical protein